MVLLQNDLKLELRGNLVVVEFVEFVGEIVEIETEVVVVEGVEDVIEDMGEPKVEETKGNLVGVLREKESDLMEDLRLD